MIFSLIAGDIGDVTLTFTTQNPIPANGVIFLEVPDTFTDVNAAAVASMIGIDGTFVVTTTPTAAAVFDNTMKTSGGNWLITLTRQGDGGVVAEDVEVTLVITELTNMQFEGPSGEFVMVKTTLADGVTAIDETSAEADSIGLNGPSVTIVPSGWSGVAPTVVPLSLVAGDIVDFTLTFTTQNPIPSDGKIFLEIPDTFTNVSASLISSMAGIDGTFIVNTTTVAPASFTKTLKNSGGPWLIEISRQNDGGVVAEDVVVTLTINELTNMQYEGPSGDFILIKTTLSDGTSAIDETSSEVDSIGSNGPSITVTPSGFKLSTPTITPASLVAGEESDLTVTFTTQNPIPIDGVIFLTVPSTFTTVTATSISSSTNLDGGFTVTQVGAASTFVNTLKVSGGPWTVRVARDSTGSVTPEDALVSLSISTVTVTQWSGGSGTFPLLKTTLADGLTGIDESSLEPDSIGIIPPGVTIVPQTFSTAPNDSGAVSARPDSLIAGLDSTFSFSVTLWNPLPSNGTLLLHLPPTFYASPAGQPFSKTTYLASPDVSGTAEFERDGSGLVYYRRNGDGPPEPAGATLNFQLDGVFNPISVGDTGPFFFQTFRMGDATIIDQGSAPSIYVDKMVTGVGVEFGSTTVAVKEQMKQWYFHGYGMTDTDKVKWVDNSAVIDEDCNTLGEMR